MKRAGFFVVLEGPEGSGKSTLLDRWRSGCGSAR